MKIDFEYIKVMLEKFIVSETEYINTSCFQELIDENIEKFSFHWNILNDKKIIVNTSNSICYSLIQKSSNSILIKHQRVRLNDDGYKFYEALENKEFLNKIKNDFKNSSIDTIFSLANKFIENKILKSLE